MEVLTLGLSTSVVVAHPNFAPATNYLIRDDAALLARLQTEDLRSRRLGRGAATGAIAPERGASPAHPGARESHAARRARTSRTNPITQDVKPQA